MAKSIFTILVVLFASLLQASFYNPCGIVVGEDAWFKMDVQPDDFPDSQIRWFASGRGAVTFPDGNTGRRLRVRGVTSGDLTLSVQIGDAESARPSFHARVVSKAFVRISTWILADEQGAAATVAHVNELVAGANEIWSQAGVVFVLSEVVVTNMPGYLDVRRDAIDGVTHAQVVNLRHDTGGLELYCVRSLPNGVVAANSSGGLVLGPNASVSTLAHELGHACGLRDIYPSRDGQTLPLSVSREFLPQDWNSEARNGYWPATVTMRVLLPRLLMYGYRETDKCDITIGDVMGVWYTSQQSSDGGGRTRTWHTSLAPIGFFVHGSTAPVHQ